MPQTIIAEYERRQHSATAEYARAEVRARRYKIGTFVAVALTARALSDFLQQSRGAWLFALMAAITVVLTFLLFRSRDSTQSLAARWAVSARA